VNGDSQFDQLAGTNTYDASILEVTFIPDTAYISMQFTFASEEYPEYVGSIFNVAVGIWINGVEVSGPVFDVAQINSVNQDANERYLLTTPAMPPTLRWMAIRLRLAF
jgi:hypothetical protein